MTTAHNIDLPAVLAERLTTTHPDVLRELLATFIHTLMGAEADALCGAGYGERSTERTNSRNGYRHRQFDTRTGPLDLVIGSGDPEAAPRFLLPGLAAGTPQARRVGPDHRGRRLLPRRSVHPSDGQAGQGAGDRLVVEVPGQQDGR